MCAHPSLSLCPMKRETGIDVAERKIIRGMRTTQKQKRENAEKRTDAGGVARTGDVTM